MYKKFCIKNICSKYDQIFLNSFLNQTRNTMCCKNCDLSNVYFKKILFSSIATFPTFCFFYLKFYTLYFYKQHFYKQRQAGICKKNKQKLSNTLKLNYCYLKIIRFLHPRYHPKIIGSILKNVPKNKYFCLMMLYD